MLAIWLYEIWLSNFQKAANERWNLFKKIYIVFLIVHRAWADFMWFLFCVVQLCGFFGFEYISFLIIIYIEIWSDRFPVSMLFELFCSKLNVNGGHDISHLNFEWIKEKSKRFLNGSVTLTMNDEIKSLNQNSLNIFFSSIILPKNNIFFYLNLHSFIIMVVLFLFLLLDFKLFNNELFQT